MPTSGTHITVVEQLALHDPQMKALLGDPLADPATPAGKQMRFAKLGAVGPDVLYMLGDFNSVPATALQNLENLLVKIGGTFSCLSDLSERVNKWLTGELDEITNGIASELQQTSALIKGTITNGLIALLVDNGVNVWSFFRSPRQEDYPRTNWFWADCLHYQYTGVFVKKLLSNAKQTRNPNLYAYALGYLTHYVTDVVGHPYVNQVVQGPFRLHWQRHHLVENFMDAYTWDRWHVQRPELPGAAEAPLDASTFVPNAMGQGATVLMSRLHDHINVGHATLGDPVDEIIETVCKKIEKGLFDVGVLEDTEIEPPSDADFDDWTKLLVRTISDVHSGVIHPTILAAPPDPRPSGIPRKEDVAGAYGVLRLLLKISTEEEIKEPVFPDIVGDVTQVIQETMDRIASDIGGIPPFPTPNTSGSFSLDSLLDSLADIAEWVGEVAEGVGKALVDAVAGAVAAAVAVVTDAIKVLLWLLDSALYTLYRYFRQILVLNGYSSPMPDELMTQIGSLNTADLWISKGDLRKGMYPAEENVHAREHISNPYRPYIPPAIDQIFELPPVMYTAPYAAGSRPESFLEVAAGPDSMFSAAALQTPTVAGTPQHEKTFTAGRKLFGGAIQNSANAIRSYESIGNDLVLPDFDMDGDRGYGWPGWQVDPNPASDPLDPLNPANQAGDHHVHVNAVNTVC